MGRVTNVQPGVNSTDDVPTNDDPQQPQSPPAGAPDNQPDNQ